MNAQAALRGAPAPEPQRDRLLVDGPKLLELLFDPDSRPSLRWLRKMQREKRIPYIKIGHLVRFDVDEVRQALDEKWTVRSRTRI